MSLINDMLRDLEQRRGGQPVTGYDALAGVSPATAPTGARPLVTRSILIGLCGGLAIAGAAWLALERLTGSERVDVAPPIAGAAGAVVMQTTAAPTPLVDNDSGADTATALAAVEVTTEAALPRDTGVAVSGAASVPVAETAAPAADIDPVRLEAPQPDAHDPAPAVTLPGSIERQQSHAPPSAADRLAAILSRLRDPSDGGARDELAALVAAHPHMAAARAEFARELLRAGDESRAATTLTDGLVLDPTDGTLAQLLAHLLVARGDTSTALTVLEAGIPAPADRGEYLALAAALYQREARHAAAVDAYREALSAAPGRGAWWIGLAISLAALDDAEGANRAYQRALIDRDLSDRLRAWANRELGRLETRG